MTPIRASDPFFGNRLFLAAAAGGTILACYGWRRRRTGQTAFRRVPRPLLRPASRFDVRTPPPGVARGLEPPMESHGGQARLGAGKGGKSPGQTQGAHGDADHRLGLARPLAQNAAGPGRPELRPCSERLRPPDPLDFQRCRPRRHPLGLRPVEDSGRREQGRSQGPREPVPAGAAQLAFGCSRRCRSSEPHPGPAWPLPSTHDRSERMNDLPTDALATTSSTKTALSVYYQQPPPVPSDDREPGSTFILLSRGPCLRLHVSWPFITGLRPAPLRRRTRRKQPRGRIDPAPGPAGSGALPAAVRPSARLRPARSATSHAEQLVRERFDEALEFALAQAHRLPAARPSDNP